VWGKEGVRGEGGACEREGGVNLFTTIRQRHPRVPPAIPLRGVDEHCSSHWVVWGKWIKWIDFFRLHLEPMAIESGERRSLCAICATLYVVPYHIYDTICSAMSSIINN